MKPAPAVWPIPALRPAQQMKTWVCVSEKRGKEGRNICPLFPNVYSMFCYREMGNDSGTKEGLNKRPRPLPELQTGGGDTTFCFPAVQYQ